MTTPIHCNGCADSIKQPGLCNANPMQQQLGWKQCNATATRMDGNNAMQQQLGWKQCNATATRMENNAMQQQLGWEQCNATTTRMETMQCNSN